VRHTGRLNVAFCDGHVDNRAITAADLATVWIKAP
jgi:prepilin-type processing-associated H-X9-DG protein